MSLRKSIPAGLLDAGFNSLGTFVVGVAATRLFDLETLGVYAVFFAAHLVGVVVPMQLIYVPVEVVAVAHHVSERLAFLPHSLVVAAAPSLVAAAAVPLAALVVLDAASTRTLLALGISAAAATALAPTQAHVRRMFHLADQSWKAAGLSVFYFIAILGWLSILVAAGVPAPWIPFGALALTEATTVLIGLMAARLSRSTAPESLRFRRLAASGRWLLVLGLVQTGAAFAVAAIITKLAGADQLGYALAASLGAQPIFVFGVGLNAVLGPRSMEAGSRRDLGRALHVAKMYRWLLVAAALGYLAVAGGPWLWNPVYHIIPTAYDLPGLVALMIIAHVVGGVFAPHQRELLGGRKEKALARIHVWASALSVVLATTAAAIGAYAKPVSLLGQNALLGRELQSERRRLFLDARAVTPPSQE
jgi:hypothetical protein